MKRLREGDVVEIPLDPHGFAYGQIVTAGTVFRFAILPDFFEVPQTAATLDTGSPLAFCSTTAGELHRGAWRVIGHEPVTARLPRPRHKVSYQDTMMVEDFDGAFIRRASEPDEAFYDHRLSISSPAVKDFMLAHHGLSEAAPDLRHYSSHQFARMQDPS